MLRSPVVLYEAAADKGGPSTGSGRSASTLENDQDPNEGGDDGARSFTQDELDALFAQRAAQAKSAVLKETLETLGVESVEEAGNALAAARVAQEEQMSELERAQAAQAAAEAEAEIARSEGSLALERANTVLMRSAVLVEAKNQGFEYPEDVWEQLDREALSLADNGATVQGVEGAVKSVAKARPLWLKAPDNRYGTPVKGTRRIGSKESGDSGVGSPRRLVKF